MFIREKRALTATHTLYIYAAQSYISIRLSARVSVPVALPVCCLSVSVYLRGCRHLSVCTTERQRHRQTETAETDTDRKRQAETDGDRQRQRQTATDNQTDKQAEAGRQSVSQTDRQYVHTYVHTYIPSCIYTDADAARAYIRGHKQRHKWLLKHGQLHKQVYVQS